VIRDDEMQRLVNYAKGLGLKVTFTDKDKGVSALWTLDNTEITICKKANKTKIETILSLIHEIAHAKHNLWEKDRKIDVKFENALDHIDNAEKHNSDPKKDQRKIVLDNEIAGTKYWHEIYKETNMKFPIWRLEVAMEYDIWQYEVFYKTGHDASFKERKKKLKEISRKYRSK
jgi:hypothetical protein